MYDPSKQNAQLSFDGSGRPVVHILRFDEGTSALRSLPVISPESPTSNEQTEFRWVLQNKAGQTVVDSQTGKPIYHYVDSPRQLPIPMMTLGLIEEPLTMLKMADVIERTGRSRATIKRDMRKGLLRRTSRGAGLAGFLKRDVDAYLAALSRQRVV